MQYTSVYSRVLIALFVAPLVAVLSAAPAAGQDPDGSALAAQCAAHDWSTYMLCQRALLDVRRAGDYCAPEPDNAALYQIEFARFAGENPALVNGVPAPAAAAAYFARHHGCD